MLEKLLLVVEHNNIREEQNLFLCGLERMADKNLMAVFLFSV